VLTLTFRDGKKAVINTQRPTRQLWLAANARAWHFAYDEATSKWLDDKGQGVELFQRVAAIVKEHGGIDVATPE
jgi:CyaY protein